MIITILGGNSSSTDFDVDPNVTVNDVLSVFREAGNIIHRRAESLALFKQVRNQAKEVRLDENSRLVDCDILNGDILWLKQV